MDLKTVKELENRGFASDKAPYNASLFERVDLNDRLAVFKFRPDSGAVPRFEPGQFATLGLRSGDGESKKGLGIVRRAYSIASAPEEGEFIEFYISLVDGGAVTPRLFAADAGERVWLGRRAHGHFTLQHIPKGKDYVFVATGTGLAPYISMIRHHHHRAMNGSEPHPWRKCLLVHGAHRSVDLGYREELEEIERRDPTVRYLPLVDHEPKDSDWQGLRGRVQAILDDSIYREAMEAPLSPEQTHVFLCGNPAMIESMEAELSDRGFVKSKGGRNGNVHVERFWH